MKSKIYSLSVAMVVFLFASLQLKAQTPTITLLQPTDPGIEWTAGGTYVVSWLDNFPHGVDVILTDNSGNTVDTLDKNVLGSVYYWNTTGVALGTYKIKVESTLAHSYQDISNHTFKLVDQTDGTITLNQPTGNEIWSVGNTYVISWNDNLVAPVQVELLKNGGPYDTLVTSTTGSTYYWTIPDSLANAAKIYKIKVSSTVTGATTSPATSGYFKIKASSGTYIEVYQPNGYESWARGTTHVISWNDDIGENVNIELYDNTGKYTDLASDVTGTTYYWTISDTTDANNYQVYVRSVSDPTGIFDKSDHYFSITLGEGSYIEVYQPNGHESWARGTTHVISWNDDLTEPVNVELWNGSGKYANLATNVTGTTYYWTISDTTDPGDDYKVYVVSSKDPNIKDNSHHNFSITKSTGTSLVLYQPNGHESWARNTSHLISWNNDFPEGVNILLMQGSIIKDTIGTDVIKSTMVWDIPATTETGNNYRVEIYSTLDSTNLHVLSAHNFSITASTGTSISMNQPVGGESWARNTSHLISWTDDFPEGVNILLMQGATIKDTIGLDILGSTMVWDIPAATATGTYKVEVFSTLDSTNLHAFSGNFSITASTGTFITVLQPDGGEVWAAGTSYWISWNDDFTEGVNIELWKNGGYDSNIATDVLGSAYSWTIPVTQSPNTHYKVEIYSTLDSTNLHDFSNGYFEIVPQTMMTVYPNPANNQITINMENMQGDNGYTLQVFDRFNKPVVELQTSSATTTLSTTGLSDGIYFVVATSDKNRVTQKIIIQH